MFSDTLASADVSAPSDTEFVTGKQYDVKKEKQSVHSACDRDITGMTCTVQCYEIMGTWAQKCKSSRPPQT